MSKVLNGINAAVSVRVIYLGIYNIVNSSEGSTAELQQTQLWMGIMALSISKVTRRYTYLLKGTKV